MLHSGQWKWIFWLVQTIFYIFLQRFLPEKPFFPFQWKHIFEGTLHAIREGFFSLMETVTLLESFFLLVETVTAMCGNQFLKTEEVVEFVRCCQWNLNFWLMETVLFHHPNQWKRIFQSKRIPFFPANENDYFI